MTASSHLLVLVLCGVLAGEVRGVVGKECKGGREEASISSTSTVPTPGATSGSAPDVSPAMPGWATDAVFYQIFPERFRNGDPTNDPTRDSLEDSARVPVSWSVTPWTHDWYKRSSWEQQLGDNFYEHGVFDRRYGGDLQGVIDKLDYLESLGINAVYFNPVFYARSLHKYDGNSFHHVDPHFGPDPAGDFVAMAIETADPATWKWTAADKLFLKLIADAHARGIRVIIDGVFNHTGRGFFAFADLQERQKSSPYRDWYVVKRFDDPATKENEFDYAGWWGIATLPEFAHSPNDTDLQAGPKKYIFDVTARWMDPNGDGDPSDGIDGWRLDVANEVPTGFWSDWNAYVRELNPQAYTVAEMWSGASDFLRRGGFSATMNYHGFAYLVKGFLIDDTLAATQFATQLDARRHAYAKPTQVVLQNLIDSHDTERVASMIVNAGRQSYEQPERFDYDVSSRVSLRHNGNYMTRKPNDRERRIQRMVALFQMTYVGAPMIYYGTEVGMWGGDDPDDRMPMVWDDMCYASPCVALCKHSRSAKQVRFDHPLFKYYQQVIRLRRTHASLRSAELEMLTSDDGRHIVAFSRHAGDETLVVILNRSDDRQEITLDRQPIQLGPEETLEPLFVSRGVTGAVKVKESQGLIRVTIPSLTGVVLSPFTAKSP